VLAVVLDELAPAELELVLLLLLLLLLLPHPVTTIAVATKAATPSLRACVVTSSSSCKCPE